MEHCSACKRSFDHIFRAPMLTDAAWAKLAQEHELLCADCFFTRADDRKVPIGLADLLPCPFNLFHRPMSWFDLFAKGERREVIEAWLAKAEGRTFLSDESEAQERQ